MNTSRQRLPNRRGMALIWVAIVGIVFVVFFALSMDTARVYMARHQLQNAADAAALAAAYRVRDNPPVGQEPPGAHETAKRVARDNTVGGDPNVGGGPVLLADNLGNAANGDIVIGFYDTASDTFSPTLVSPNAVKVTARRTADSPGGALPLLFAKLAGVQSSNVSRTATAVVGGPTLGAGLVLLNPHAPAALKMTGTGSTGTKVIVQGGAVQVNSDNPDAVSWSGDPAPQVVANALYDGGNQPDASAVIPSGTLSVNAPPVADPLGSLPPPAKPGLPVGNTQTVLNQGYYNNFPTNRSVKLNPGIYWIDGGINVNGNRVIDATAGVMIFLNTGGINLGGGSSIKINPTNIAPYQGISIYQARGNTSNSSLQGTPGTSNSGVFYFPSAHLTVAGNPDTYATQIIADTLEVQGNATVNINYSGSPNQIQGHKIWLVR